MSEKVEKCPVCGGKLKTKTVEKILRGGENTAVLEVEAEVCTRCGERLYSQETIEKFENIRERLKDGDVDQMKPMGRVFRVA